MPSRNAAQEAPGPVADLRSQLPTSRWSGSWAQAPIPPRGWGSCATWARRLRRLREFGLDASHELRGPLAALAANAEMGLLDCPDAESGQRRRFAAIASATDQMGHLADDLLQLVRQEEGKLEQPSRLWPWPTCCASSSPSMAMPSRCGANNLRVIWRTTSW